MTPHNIIDDAPVDLENNPQGTELVVPAPPSFSENPPRILIIGAGSRGRTYARCTKASTNGIVVAVAEPDEYKRRTFGRNFIWGSDDNKPPAEGSQFADWSDFIVYEKRRRERLAAGEEGVPEGVDAAFVCLRDELHHDVVVALAPLGLHIMCEKPLATTLDDCVSIYKSLACPEQANRVFGIGHVMRYSPHNIMLRKVLLEDRAIGDILSVMHTEPVGWWHFAHSYVRGNWRKESATAPSLLTKSCHDIDLILWLLCSPHKQQHVEVERDGGEQMTTTTTSPPPLSPPHIPSTISSSGSLQFYKKSRKPLAAGDATNCLSCPVESDCMYSSKRIYVGGRHQGLATGNTGWPLSIVLPDIESFGTKGSQERERALLDRLGEDYDSKKTPQSEIDSRNWFGRCVFESDNDVCDEQTVVMTWDEEPLPPPPPSSPSSSTAPPMAAATAVGSRGSKQATFHMVSSTKKQCNRYTYFYGTTGEIYADSWRITVEDFVTGTSRSYEPKMESLGHGGGDVGLTRQFVTAVDKVKNYPQDGWTADRAQQEFIGCDIEEIIRSHAMVFAAEEARTERKVVDWKAWWGEKVAAAAAQQEQASQ